jgi:hypothetical protein
MIPSLMDLPTPRRNDEILPWIQELARRANRRIEGPLVQEGPNGWYIRLPIPEVAPISWALAYADWQIGSYADSTLQSADYVYVQDCNDQAQLIDNTQTPWQLWLPHGPGVSPNVFEGQLIAYTIDGYGNPVAAGSYTDDALGTIKFFYQIDLSDISAGWNMCDGSTPSGSKIGTLPDTRGLFTRPTDVPYGVAGGNMWSDGNPGKGPPENQVGFDQYIGPADNTGGNDGDGAWGSGGRIGIICSIENDGIYPAGTVPTVNNLLDVPTWAQPPQEVSDGYADPDNGVVVCPPCYVLVQMIRFK